MATEKTFEDIAGSLVEGRGERGGGRPRESSRA
jgi:hypothetical protein